MNIVFVGAGNRVTMAEHFIVSARKIGLALNFYSLEYVTLLAPPIADVFEVINSPKFDTPEFTKFFTHLRKELTAKTLFIPFMDSAVRELSKYQSTENEVFLSTASMANVTDKSWLSDFCRVNKIPHPFLAESSSRVVIKPRYGFGTNGMEILSVSDSKVLAAKKNPQSVVQEFIPGTEVSLDCYFAKDGQFNAIARDRLRVVGGEVMETSTRDLTEHESYILKKLAGNLDFVGPINIQLIGNPSLLLEINPRFSGGATASVSAGWLGPEWLIKEYLMKTGIDLGSKYSHVHVVRSRRDHIRRSDG